MDIFKGAKKLGFGLMRLPLTDPKNAASIDIEHMKKMVDAMREKMPGASDDEVLAALEKEQEWRSLRCRIVDLETASADNRRRTAEVVREYKDVSAPASEGK